MEKIAKLVVNGVNHDYKIIKKRKKQISIKIEKNLSILVTAPFKISYEEIEKIVAGKSSWIEKNIKAVDEYYKRIAEKEIEFIDKILFLGEEYLIKKINSEKRLHIEIIDNVIFYYHNKKESKKKLLNWFYKNGIDKIMEIHKKYEKLTGLNASEVKFRNMKNWGMCSSKGKITYNIKLICAPEDVIEYVVLHEISHLKELNHSKKFWEIVIRYIENYREKKEWLRNNSNKIEFTLKNLVI